MFVGGMITSGLGTDVGNHSFSITFIYSLSTDMVDFLLLHIYFSSRFFGTCSIQCLNTSTCASSQNTQVLLPTKFIGRNITKFHKSTVFDFLALNNLVYSLVVKSSTFLHQDIGVKSVTLGHQKPPGTIMRRRWPPSPSRRSALQQKVGRMVTTWMI